MSDERTPSEITLELVFRQGQRILAELGGIGDSLAELTTRVGRLEREVADLHRQVAMVHGDFADLSSRLDRFDQRLRRIERRLDLVETPAANIDSAQ